MPGSSRNCPCQSAMIEGVQGSCSLAPVGGIGDDRRGGNDEFYVIDEKRSCGNLQRPLARRLSAAPTEFSISTPIARPPTLLVQRASIRLRSRFQSHSSDRHIPRLALLPYMRKYERQIAQPSHPLDASAHRQSLRHCSSVTASSG
jgi:hypothetical protein